MRQCFGFATTTTWEHVRASETSKNMTKVKALMSKWICHKECTHTAISYNFWAWKHCHVVAAVLFTCPALLTCTFLARRPHSQTGSSRGWWAGGWVRGSSGCSRAPWPAGRRAKQLILQAVGGFIRQRRQKIIRFVTRNHRIIFYKGEKPCCLL